MRHPIDPKIDCVFKALLGAEANRRLLIHFLNAVLWADLSGPVVEVEILDPYNEREFLDDKLSIVDVKARDALGRVFQVEIQLLAVPDLLARILYGWADLYSEQLKDGQDYGELKPTYSIWLLGETLLRDAPDYVHRFRMRDEQGRGLIDHGGIYLLELGKFARAHARTEDVADELERWLRFFTEAERLDEDALPPWMQTEEMKQAMSVLIAFSEKERAYHAYQARQNLLRQQRSIERRIAELSAAAEQAQAQLEQERALLARERAEKEQARAAQERERAEKEQERAAKDEAHAQTEAVLQREAAALAEIERLKRLLTNSSSR